MSLPVSASIGRQTPATPAPTGVRFRHEDFGGIVALVDPPALVHVDQEMARSLGYPAHPRWESPAGYLSAPTEVHVLTTERCPAGCPSCYVDATPHRAEPTTDELKRWFDRLAEAGVFHVALGGGESLLREDLFEIAAHARSRGLVPNLTTSGIGMTPANAQACRVFGQVNVSLDGLGEIYRLCRGYDGAALALKALQLLADAGVSTGINLVVQRANFDALPQTIAAAAAHGAHEVELLRFKPAGRGKVTYLGGRLDEAQGRALLPRVLALAQVHPTLNLKIDCSFVPMLCAADPDPALLASFGVIGCEAGNVLAAVRADGTATPCSFVEQGIGTIDDLVDRWDDHPDLHAWRGYADTAPAPCNTCAYRLICRGGCKVVSLAVGETLFSPDPECPRVIAHTRGVPFTPVPLAVS